jgi:hypothetical protein
MELEKATFTKNDLKGLETEEILFYFQIMNYLTEMNMCVKMKSFFLQQFENEVALKAINCNKVFLILIEGGKLFEIWKTIKLNGYFKNTIESDNGTILSKEGRESLIYLETIFAENKILKFIRNKFSFHYDIEQIKKQWDEYEDTEPFELYWSPNYVNIFSTTYYTFLDRLLSKIDPESEIAIEQLFEVISKVHFHLKIFICELLKYFGETNLGEPEALEIPDAQNIHNYTSPIFFGDNFPENNNA